MTFLNVLMLMGVGAAVLPVVLHLLSRARYRDVDWGAMMFLEGADARQRQSMRLSQWLLMAVRVAVIALLAAALARPVVRREWAGGAAAAAGQEPRVTAAIVLDASASMAFDENSRTRFDLARAAALQVLSALRPGDRAALIVLGRPQDEDETRPTSDLRDVAARLEALRPGHGVADLRAGLERAAVVLEEDGPAGRDIYVIADRQELTWKALDDSFQVAWRERQARAAVPTRLFAVPVGNNAADNVVVEAVELPNGPAVRGQSAEVEIRLRNRGSVQRAALPLVLRLDGNVVYETTVDLPPDSPVTVRAPLKFAETGSHLLSAAVTTTGLTADDRLDAAVDVTDPIPVLVLSGDERAGTFRGEADFFRLALAPYRSTTAPAAPEAEGNPARIDPARVTVVPAEKWEDVELSRFRVVVLANVERPDEQMARALEQYVYGGGGLLIAPGGLSRPEEYNEALYRGGAGVMPAALLLPTPADGSRATTLLGFDPNHPVFRFLRGRPDPIPSATIGRYFPTATREGLAYYVSGDPFLIESPPATAGRGRVLLMTTPLDADWGTLPLSNFYLPFVQSAVRYLAGGGAQDRNLKPGDPIHVAFDDPAEGRAATLYRPDGAGPVSVPVRPVGNGEVRYADTHAPGVYRLVIRDAPDGGDSDDGKAPRTLHFVVRPPPEESDLAQLPPARWDWLADALGLQRIDPDAQPIAATVARSREGRELWPLLIGAVIALAVLEIALARTWVRDEV